MRKTRYFILLLLANFVLIVNADGKITVKDVFKAIKDGNIELVEQFLRNGNDINANYGRESMTLLNYAIRNGSTNIVKRLLELGADPDHPNKGKTPLMYSIRHRELEMARLLIKFGANLDKRAKKDYTALMYAAKSGKLEFVKLLVENGASTMLKNSNELTALDLSNMANYPAIATYLVKIIELRNYYKNSPHYADGPHIEWINDSLVRMFYMRFDTVKKFPVLREDYFPVFNDTATITSFAEFGKKYTLLRDIQPEPSIYEDVDKILALGDIHGHYTSLVNYLKAMEVIDDSLHWIWGDGHLILLGDVFDRGNEVTESLWLIYQLGLQAKKSGGRVHMLLGNHEVMVMVNDTRYLNRKYALFSNYFQRDYARFYDKNSELGRWLRTRNTVIRINDYIFSHAGISPKVFKRRLSIPTINQLLQDYLANDPDIPNKSPGLTSLILNAYGPLWYRGYVSFGAYGVQNGNITQKEVDRILKYYDASRMVIAHNEVRKIISKFDGKVITIDIPIRTKDYIPEALFINRGNFYRLKYDGTAVQIAGNNK